MPEKWILIGKNFEITLADEYCEALGIEVGDILLCTLMKDKRSIKLEKFSDQSLNDEQIKAHGYLCRVEELNPEDFE